MSDISSVCSSVSSDYGNITDFPEKYRKVSARKQNDNILQRLRNREMGSSLAKPKFPVIPDRLKFQLCKTLPTSALSSHIFLGISKCGQLLITYTYTTDIDDRSMSFSTMYKYRLHWWAFVPYSIARKVAEVTLFGNYNIYTPLVLAVCQWPSDVTKLVVYGACYETHEGNVFLGCQPLRSYVTITAVPSLNNCLECQKVAASFEEEDIAASWDSCVRFSCLTHGLTVHTSFDVAPPYPSFQAKINMKCDNKLVLNTGNFLHVISMRLENSFRGGRQLKIPSETIQSQPEPMSIGTTRILATSNLNVRMSEYHTLVGLPPSSPFASLSDHNSCDSRSLMEELSITCQGHAASSPSRNAYCRPDLLMMETESDESSQISAILSPPLRNRTYHLWSPSASPRGQQGRLTTTVAAEAEKAYEFTEKDIEKNYETLSSFRKRRLADKKYEFSEEDFEDSENIVPFRVMRSPNRLPPSPLVHAQRDRSTARTAGSIAEPPDLLVHHRRRGVGVGAPETGNGVSLADSEPSGLHSPPGTGMPAPVVTHCDVVLRPQNRNHPLLLSPREQDQWDGPREANKKAVHVYLDNNALSLPPNPQMSPQHGHTRFGATSCSGTCASDIANGNGNALIGVNSANANTNTNANPANSSPALTTETDAIRAKGSCTIQFERRFIEVDDDLVSVITDIEDDDESGMTGYHSALPLEVHGSGYVHMQMISNSKAEKLMAPCALVHQMSFDIEQFCYEVAEVLCERAGMKFWCCNNYDVEIVEVCPLTGDVMCLAFMKIKATVKTKEPVKCERIFVERQQYETSCLLVWNMNSGGYRLDSAGAFEQVSPTVSEEVTVDTWIGQTNDPMSVDEWNPARGVALSLQAESAQNVHCSCPSVRVATNLPAVRGHSLAEIRDSENGISFIL